jgi:hypothetical protein
LAIVVVFFFVFLREKCGSGVGIGTNGLWGGGSKNCPMLLFFGWKTKKSPHFGYKID